MKTIELSIINNRGLNLAGNMDMPDDDRNIRKYAIFAHCFTCSKELKAIANINAKLTEFGIAVLRFDMTGIGSSEGKFEDTNFTTQLDDFDSAYYYLKANYSAPEMFIGHSLGGSVALFSALKYSDVKAVVTIASPAEPSHLAHKLRRTKERALKEGIAETEIGGVKFNFKAQFFDDIAGYTLGNKLLKLKTPYMILHSPVDTYSDFENAEILFQRANHPKALISLDDIDHLMLEKEDAYYVGKLIGVWSEKYL